MVIISIALIVLGSKIFTFDKHYSLFQDTMSLLNPKKFFFENYGFETNQQTIIMYANSWSMQRVIHEHT